MHNAISKIYSSCRDILGYLNSSPTGVYQVSLFPVDSLMFEQDHRTRKMALYGAQQKN